MRATSSRSSRTHTTTAITTPLEPPCCLSATVPQWRDTWREGWWGGGLVGWWREDRGGRKVWGGGSEGLITVEEVEFLIWWLGEGHHEGCREDGGV